MADKAATHDHDDDFQTGDAGASATLVFRSTKQRFSLTIRCFSL